MEFVIRGEYFVGLGYLAEAFGGYMLRGGFLSGHSLYVLYPRYPTASIKIKTTYLFDRLSSWSSLAFCFTSS
jgi:hypothetical protein